VHVLLQCHGLLLPSPLLFDAQIRPQWAHRKSQVQAPLLLLLLPHPLLPLVFGM
jgi:hypothetical protein